MQRNTILWNMTVVFLILSSGCRESQRPTSKFEEKPRNEAPRRVFSDDVLDKVLYPDKHNGLLQQGQFLATDELKYLLDLPKMKKYPSPRQALEEEYGWHDAALSYSQKSDIIYEGETIPTAPNCLQCHAGKLDGKLVVGRPNTQIDLGGLLKDLSPNLRRRLEGDYRQAQLYSGVFEGVDWNTALARVGMLINFERYFRDSKNHNLTRGTSNAFAHSIALLKWRDNDMGYSGSILGRPELRGDIVPSYIDAPAWWLLKYKDRLYAEARIKKSARVIMQFVMSPDNSEASIKAQEPMFQEFFQAIENTDPPAYPLPLDGERVAAGERIFNIECASCHGVHSRNGEYFRDPASFTWPARVMTATEIGTDGERSKTLGESFFEVMEQSWLTFYGVDNAVRKTGALKGYAANPLFGIWASSPYLHNGSVPTLRHLMDPKLGRPQAWRPVDRQGTVDYDNLGLKVALVKTTNQAADRSIYNTTVKGQSAAGHEVEFRRFGVDRDDLENLLEYLKSL